MAVPPQCGRCTDVISRAERCAFVRRFCASCCVSIGVTRSNACAWRHTLHCNVHGSDLAVAAPRWPQIGHMIAIRATVYTFKGQGTQRARSSPSPTPFLTLFNLQSLASSGISLRYAAKTPFASATGQIARLCRHSRRLLTKRNFHWWHHGHPQGDQRRPSKRLGTLWMSAGHASIDTATRK